MEQDQSQSLSVRSTHAGGTEPEIKEGGQGSNSAQEATEIDRFSSLPPELLDKIFDHAHTLDQPSTGPLSKRLLPFHITGIYRRIKLSKIESKLLRLVEKLDIEPQCGERIRTLQLQYYMIGDEDSRIRVIGALEKLFRNLRRLEELDIDSGIMNLFHPFTAANRGDQQALPLNSSVLPALRTLRVTGTSTPTPGFPLLFFSSLDSLVQLDYEYSYEYISDSTIWNGPFPKKLARLSIEGVFERDPAIARFASLCPNLTSLRLRGSNPIYESILQALPDRLIELELLQYNRFGEGPEEIPCDHLLSRFTRLQRLSLGNRRYSEDLPVNIAHLSLLEHLDLGHGSIPLSSLHSLFSGPTRLPLLRTLHLDLIPYAIGTRLDVDDEGYHKERTLPDRDFEIEEDWRYAEYECEEGDEFTIKGLPELIRSAKEEGIEIEGPILKAGEARRSFFLELANVVVYRAYLMKSGFCYGRLRLPARISSMHSNLLDMTKVKLVKKWLPEENWFSLSLE
ncbi:uncharacterized protein JCM6883_005648 [Sporobolomyces salmoneus]|uniref:uncharacterized protein n=1 Tax=Sporobolomyces salmoneus TaxID=183962 RepID=UPI0031784C70